MGGPGDNGDRDSFAMVARSVLTSGVDDICLRLWLYLDDEIGGQPTWRRSVAQVARGLSRQPRTIEAHARHLETLSIVAIYHPSGKASPQLRLRQRPRLPGVPLPAPAPVRHRRLPTIGEREHTRAARMPNRT